MKMKKILVVALAAVMSLSLVSCANGGDSSTSGESGSSVVNDESNSGLSESTPDSSNVSESTPDSSEGSESTPADGTSSEDPSLEPASDSEVANDGASTAE